MIAWQVLAFTALDKLHGGSSRQVLQSYWLMTAGCSLIQPSLIYGTTDDRWVGFDVDAR